MKTPYSHLRPRSTGYSAPPAAAADDQPDYWPTARNIHILVRGYGITRFTESDVKSWLETEAPAEARRPTTLTGLLTLEPRLAQQFIESKGLTP